MVNPADFIANSAKNGNSNQSKGKSVYLNLEDSVPVTFRMLTAFAPKYVISHSCGMAHVEVDKAKFDLAMQSGQPFLCPQCGQPLSFNDIEMERPIVEGVYMHRFIPTSNPTKKANFACLGNPQNAEWGVVETNPDGTPKYHCPICDAVDDKGKPYRPQPRLIGLAVERTPHIEMQMVGGIRQPIMTGCEDVMVTDEDGTVHPKVIIIDLPFKSFWSVLMSISPAPDYELSICYYDWQVTRTGDGLNTKYDVQRLNPAQPSTIDPRPYKEWSTDLHEMVQFWGSPKKYTDNGWAIAGYVPPVEEQAQQPVQAPAPVHQYVAPAYGQGMAYGQPQAPVQPVPMPSAPVIQQPIYPSAPTTSWSAIQQQIG